MAKPIKETPFLSGKEARKFIKANSIPAKETGENKQRIRENYNALKGIAKF